MPPCHFTLPLQLRRLVEPAPKLRGEAEAVVHAVRGGAVEPEGRSRAHEDQYDEEGSNDALHNAVDCYRRVVDLRIQMRKRGATQLKMVTCKESHYSIHNCAKLKMVFDFHHLPSNWRTRMNKT